MTEEITTYSSQRKSKLKALLILDRPQLLLDLTIAISTLFAINVPTMWTSLTSGSPKDSSYLGQLINDYIPWLHSTYANIAEGRVVQILLWLLVGCASYLILWFFGSFFTSLRNDVVADSYVHPRFYERSKFWLSVISRKVIFVFLGMIWLVYIPLALSYLVQLAGVSYDAILYFQFQQINSVLNLVASVVTAVILVHIFFILLKLVTGNWKVIYNDL